MLKDQKEGGREYDFDKDRQWRIVNPSKKHYSSGKNVGYGLMTKEGALRMMARENSWAGKRAAFATKAMWVVKDVEGAKGGRYWPAGKYVLQTRDTPEDSVSRWVEDEGTSRSCIVCTNRCVNFRAVKVLTCIPQV